MNRRLHGSIIVLENGDIINILHKLTNTNWIVTNTKAVKEILANEQIYYYFNRKKNRPTIGIKQRPNQKEKNKFFAQLIYFCYHNDITVENVVDRFLADSETWRKEQHNEVDHLDEDKFNNCIYNLSLMSERNNQKKVGLPNKFKDSFCITLAYDGVNYRLELLYLKDRWKIFEQSEIKIYAVRYYCNNASDLIALLKTLTVQKWQLRSKRKGVEISDNKQYEIVGKYPFVKVIQSLVPMYERQKALAEMPLSDFKKWTATA